MRDSEQSPLQAQVPHHSSAVTISVVIVACDEEDVIETCLQSVVNWIDEIVVVDMESTDGTREIVRRYGARLIEHQRVPYVELVRDFALQQVTGDWVLILDPDEFPTDGLAQELRRLAELDEYDVVLIQRRDMAFGRLLTAPGLAEPPIPRFFRVGALLWGTAIHAYPDLVGLRCHTMPAADPALTLGHNTWRSVTAVSDKAYRYARPNAAHWYAAGRRFSVVTMLLMPVYLFLKLFIRGQGYRDGIVGLLKALFLSLYHLTVYAELWELEGRQTGSDQRIARWGQVLRRLSYLLRPAEFALNQLRRFGRYTRAARKGQ